MARIRFTVGVRYLLDGQVYLIKQHLLDNRVLVENQSFGGQTTVSLDVLSAAWGRGELRFEVRGIHAHQQPDQPIGLLRNVPAMPYVSMLPRCKKKPQRFLKLRKNAVPLAKPSVGPALNVGSVCFLPVAVISDLWYLPPIKAPAKVKRGLPLNRK